MQALVILAGLVALIGVMAADQTVALRAAQDTLRERRAEAAARSAVARAMAALAQTDTNLVTANDDWARIGGGDGDRGGTAYDLGDGTTTFRVQIIDAGARVNVNTAPEDQLRLMPLTQEQVDGLLDWRETGTIGRPNGGKDEFYNGLARPYNTRLNRLETLDELLLVKGWTATALFRADAQGDQQATLAPALTDIDGTTPLPLVNALTADSGCPNTSANGTALLNVANGNVDAAALAQVGVSGPIADQIARGGPYDSLETLLILPGVSPDDARRILDGLTVSPSTRMQGKLNLNTAPQSVLQTLPGVTPAVAQAIVERQTNGGFTSLGDLTAVPGLTAAAALAPLADRFTVGSDTWIVRAYGQSGGRGVAVEAVVGVRDGRAKIVTWDRLPDPLPPVWWGWAAEPSTTVDAGSATQ